MKHVTMEGINDVRLGMSKAEVAYIMESVEGRLVLTPPEKFQDKMFGHDVPDYSLHYENLVFNLVPNLCDIRMAPCEDTTFYGRDVYNLFDEEISEILTSLGFEFSNLRDGTIAVKIVKVEATYYTEFSFDENKMLDLILLSLE